MISKKILRYVQKVGFSIGAYKKLLRNRHISLKTIKLERDFNKLPVVDKKNYFYKYKFSDFFNGRKVPPMIYASSGSSGKPTFWFRGDEQEDAGGKFHEIIFRDIFGIKKDETTLVVICFSMGIWVAGNYTMAACRWVARKGYNLSVVSPGIEKEDIFNVLQEVAPHYENLIIVGYPPFLMDSIHQAFRRGIKFKNKKIRILTAGDKITEEWREKVLNMLDINDVFGGLVSIYGCADAASLAHETPLTIYLRRVAAKNKELYQELFGDALTLPSFVQYHPEMISFETVGEEIVITAPTAVPLVRYNIHDVGKIFSFNEVEKIIKKHGLEKEVIKYGLYKWQLPFIIINGRTDVAVTFYAINIFPEHILESISNKQLTNYITGNFNTYNKTTKDQKTQKLYISLELKEGISSNESIQQLALRSVLSGLQRTNIEFRKLYSVIGKRAVPVVKLIPYSIGNFTHTGRSILYIKGKKARMVL